VVLKCQQPILLTPGQPLLLRRPGASGTFAGGQVLASARLEGQRTGTLIEFGKRLIDASPADVLNAWLDLSRFLDLSDAAVFADLGMAQDVLEKSCRKGVRGGSIHRVPDSAIVISESGRCVSRRRNTLDRSGTRHSLAVGGTHHGRTDHSIKPTDHCDFGDESFNFAAGTVQQFAESL
jgi:hypothetical protein